MKIKRNIFALFFALVLLSLTGCAENSQLHQKLIVQGIGLDNSDEGYVITVQALDFKNPAKAPATAEEIIAASGEPKNKQITAHAIKENKPVDAANPSNPSVKLYAFEAPVITKTANTGYNQPKCKI